MNHIRLIVGLGNPGSEYEATRHNVGFMVIDALRNGKLRTGDGLHTADSTIWSARAAGRKVLLQKPLTFMNLSGEAVSLICRRESILPSEVLVVYDDLDLPLGRIRFRPSGGSGGHRGLQSIVDCLGTGKIPRLRIGIGRDDQREVVDFVLSPFDLDEKPLLDKVVTGSSEAVALVIRRGLKEGMNSFNGIVYQITDTEEKE